MAYCGALANIGTSQLLASGKLKRRGLSESSLFLLFVTFGGCHRRPPRNVSAFAVIRLSDCEQPKYMYVDMHFFLVVRRKSIKLTLHKSMFYI